MESIFIYGKTEINKNRNHPKKYYTTTTLTKPVTLFSNTKLLEVRLYNQRLSIFHHKKTITLQTNPDHETRLKTLKALPTIRTMKKIDQKDTNYLGNKIHNLLPENIIAIQDNNTFKRRARRLINTKERTFKSAFARTTKYSQAICL